MSCLEGLVRQYVEPGQDLLQKALRNPLAGLLVRGNLPQTWLIITESETLSIHADEQGQLTVGSGNSMVRDGAISVGHDALAASLRDGKPPARDQLHVTFYTDKGERAFSRIAPYFGL